MNNNLMLFIKIRGYKSVGDFAKRQGLNESIVKKHEDGTSKMDIDTLKKYAVMLDTHWSCLRVVDD